VTARKALGKRLPHLTPRPAHGQRGESPGKAPGKRAPLGWRQVCEAPATDRNADPERHGPRLRRTMPAWWLAAGGEEASDGLVHAHLARDPAGGKPEAARGGEQGACDPAYLHRLYWGAKEHPSVQTCEQIGYAVAAAKGLDYDAMVGVTNELLEAAGFQPLHIQRRRRRPGEGAPARRS
jgi:hypothetical protein